MIDKYYNGVIEQVYNRVGKTDRNIVMANYSNDFSIRDLDSIKRYSTMENNVFFVWHEFGYEKMVGAYEPFLDTICKVHKEYIKGSFSDFLEKCEVYYLLRPVLESYYETGVCERTETILLDEVAYEQERMTEAIRNMLCAAAKVLPIVMVINRFQLAGSSSMKVVEALLLEPSMNIGIVIGANDIKFKKESMSLVWESILELIEDRSQIYHIGSTGARRAKEAFSIERHFEKELQLLHNSIELLDLELVRTYFTLVEHRIKFEDVKFSDETLLKFYILYARTSILLGEMSKALELLEEGTRLALPGYEHQLNYECMYLIATCFMYQGKLEDAERCAMMAMQEAQNYGDERQIFCAELLAIQAKMSGWYNIFFCVKDITIPESLIEKLVRYNFKNHLAHIYIYAYDNRPEAIAKAYRSEAALIYFSKGVSLAKEIGNSQLVFAAYQKNIMLASTNGMNEIAMLYSVRVYEFLKEKASMFGGRILSGIGYNLSALGHNDEAETYFNRSIELFFDLKLPEDIAEVYYNLALNCIMMERFADAERNLLMAMKAIEKLHLNSLRVCNLSKLYGLLALCCIMQKDRFNCERYLLSCRQFLNYIIAKEKENENAEIVHDYAKCDDDMFLYTFATAMLYRLEGEDEKAFSCFEKAEKFLARAEGNQFFSYRLFRTERMNLFSDLGRTELYEIERMNLQQHEEMFAQMSQGVAMELLDAIGISEDMGPCCVPEAAIDIMIKQEGLLRDYQSNKRQMDFISMWQKEIDVKEGVSITDLVDNAIRIFLNHFSTDRALYIWYEDDTPKVLFNDTGVTITSEVLRALELSMKENARGFAVSKISDNFFEHRDAISIFDEDDICSFVAIPFFKNGSLTSILITYVRMKDNWHSSIDRYMLNEDDLHLYQLLFRELSYSIKRIEAGDKVREMNQKLKHAASTDMLTGIYNRTGMYEHLHEICEAVKKKGQTFDVGLMFADLDNFKHYNDTYGHDVGDLILKEMAKIFEAVTDESGFASRYGGDEFILLFENSNKRELEEIAKDIYRRIEKENGFKKQVEQYLGHAIELDETRKISCSIGISAASKVTDEEEIANLIRKADDRLYSVKTAEKGHYAFYED